MIRRFPYEQALLARTKLRYVDLQGVLSDAKIDRAARAPGFVALYLGGQTGLIFLRGGEAVAGGLLAAEQRSRASVSEVLQKGHAELEHAEVGYYRAPAGQLRAMWATLGAPILRPEGVRFSTLDEVVEWSGGQGFAGVLEILHSDSASYLTVGSDATVEVYLAGRVDTRGPTAEVLSRPLDGGVTVRGFAAESEIPLLAPPALFSLYERTMSLALEAAAADLGTEVAAKSFEAARRRARERYPTLIAFGVSVDGRVQAEPGLAGSDELTRAVAAWVAEAVSAVARETGRDPAELLRRVRAEQRYALEAQGFFAHLPWPSGS